MKTALVVLGMIAFLSCNKDYTCECEDATGIKSFTFLNTSKNVAEADCELLNADYANEGGACSLK